MEDEQTKRASAILGFPRSGFRGVFCMGAERTPSCILKAGALCEILLSYRGLRCDGPAQHSPSSPPSWRAQRAGPWRFPKGTPYAEARQSLKALGYRPNAVPDADAVSGDRCGYKPDSLTEPKPSAEDGDDMRCFPKMIACAGTGLGQCIYSWRRGETLIDVFATNEMPIVSGVKCRVNC